MNPPLRLDALVGDRVFPSLLTSMGERKEVPIVTKDLVTIVIIITMFTDVEGCSPAGRAA